MFAFILMIKNEVIVFGGGCFWHAEVIISPMLDKLKKKFYFLLKDGQS